MSVNTYTKTGTKSTSSFKLPSVFDEEIKSHDLLKQSYEAYLANGRSNNATTLQRGEVRGGGRKPWRQKGTGRARHGSIRSPIWRGGGVTFGPLGRENYKIKMTKKAKQKAIRQALTLAAKDGVLSIIDDISIKDGKTKEITALLSKVGLTRRTVIVVDTKTPEVVRATNNLAEVHLVAANYLNVYTIMNADNILMTKKAVEATADWLNVETKKPAAKEAK